jgi:hypothetical protein
MACWYVCRGCGQRKQRAAKRRTVMCLDCLQELEGRAVCTVCGKAKRRHGFQVRGKMCPSCAAQLARTKRPKFSPSIAHQTRAQKDALRPTSSWWMCAREEWGQRIAEQAPRHKMIGPDMEPPDWPSRRLSPRDVGV